MRDAAVVAERRADRTSVEITNENSVAAAKADSRLAADMLALMLASFGLLTGCANSDFGEVNPVLVTTGSTTGSATTGRRIRFLRRNSNTPTTTRVAEMPIR